MNFVDYCIKTKNYSAIKTIRDYTKIYALTEDDNRERRRIVGGALLGTAAALGIGHRWGKNSANDDYELAIRRWKDSGKSLDSEESFKEFLEENDLD